MRKEIDSNESARRWGEEAGVNECRVGLMVDQVVEQTRGEAFPIRYYALVMALSEEKNTIPAEALLGLLCAAVVALAVEREKP